MSSLSSIDDPMFIVELSGHSIVSSAIKCGLFPENCHLDPDSKVYKVVWETFSGKIITTWESHDLVCHTAQFKKYIKNLEQLKEDINLKKIMKRRSQLRKKKRRTLAYSNNFKIVAK